VCLRLAIDDEGVECKKNNVEVVRIILDFV
jgi:hypothetical protein